MKRFLLALALVGMVPVCFGASVDYTSYFHNTHTYTNATIVGTNSASRGVFTNGLTAGASAFTGAVGFADGTAAAPSIGWTSDADGSGTGFYRSAANRISTAINGSAKHTFWSDGAFYLIGDTAALAFGTLSDVVLTRDAADTLALRRGTNAQAFRIYGSYTDGSNHEYLGLDYSGAANAYRIGGFRSGSGTSRPVNVVINNNSVWQFSTSGHILALTDNTYDIGASGATRPRSVHVASSVIVGDYVTAARFSVPSKGYIQMPLNGVVLMWNSANTDFDRLQFGGTTTNFNGITAVTNVAGMPYLKFTDATGANLRKIVNVGHNGGRTNVLTDATETSVLWISVPNTNRVSGKLFYEIFATDGTESQGISGECKFIAVAKGTAVTAEITDVQTTAAVSAGTLAATIAKNVATNNVFAIAINSDTSLTSTNHTAVWRIESPNLFDVNPL